MQKIMFNDKFGLTKAVLGGRKTITRRAVPERVLEAYDDYDDYVRAVAPRDIPCTREYEKEFFLRHSPFKVGEVVAVAQNYKDAGYHPSYIIDEFHPNIENEAGWTNKMFVRADLMPNRIRITSVHIERLQDISDEDCLNEGIKFYNCGIDFGYKADGVRGTFGTARKAFAALIDKVSGNGTWESNPWVYVYEFELVK